MLKGTTPLCSQHIFMTTALWTSGVVLVLASATINFKFWLGQGGSEFAGLLFAVVTLGTDVAKPALPVLIDRALRARHYVSAAVASLMMVLCLIASLVAAIGYFAANRTATVSADEILTAELRIRTTELGDLERKLGSPSRTSTSSKLLKAKLEVARQNVRWTSTQQCVDATTIPSRAFCKGYHRLLGEYDDALLQDSQQRRARELRREIVRLRMQGAGRDPDPQSTALARAVG